MSSNVRRLKRQMRDQNQNVCVSNATNSRSPNDLKSRIFIGNLNTSIITKRHLHLIFITFGQIKAISMHKGYAFIQFDDQMDAINAVLAQDGQMIAGQAIDVNLVTEPKPHQKSSKTSTASNGSETSGDVTTESNSKENSVESDVNYINFENSVNEMLVECESDNQRLHPNCSSDSVSEQNSMTVESSEVQNKKVKLDVNVDIGSDTCINTEISSEISKSLENGLQCCVDESSRRSDRLSTSADSNKLINSFDNNYSYLSEQNHCSSSISSTLSNQSFGLLLNHNNSHNSQQLSTETMPLALNQISVQQNMDLMICGNCRTLFTSLSLFIRHKQSKCRLRFVCHCHKQ